jgi:hypothetical protein
MRTLYLSTMRLLFVESRGGQEEEEHEENKNRKKKNMKKIKTYEYFIAECS